MKKKAERTRRKRPEPAALAEPAVRYVAFLRGVSPVNAKMPDIKRCFERAGFEDVKTVLSSGNVVFSAPRAPNAALEKQAETAMSRDLPRSFRVIVRSVEALREMRASDPYGGHRLPPGSKRVVTFLKDALRRSISLPIEVDGASILGILGQEVFTAYVPGPRAAAFMTLLEKTFGKDVTTRTWDTVQKVAR